ncbi:hypothetical protein PISL3812_06889 [Talaromyces islandicus]|uniref:YTH domain-containing protein n=1 Tax=Talaromyces islandicus TaxID=28573 RepID=A0A0U1M477_TALIS|nr:hypothetical protein PISL3812_06889 [Talaromyces islandicus]
MGGDVLPVQSRDGVAGEKLSSNAEVGSAINKSSSGGSSQTLQEPARSKRPANPTIRLSGAEYHPASYQYAPRPSREKTSMPLNMADMNPALPPYQTEGVPFGQPNVQQQYIQTHQSQGMMYPVPQVPYMGHSPGQPMYNVPCPPGYQNTYMQGYATYQPPHQAGNTVSAQSGMYSPSYYSQYPAYNNTGFEANRTAWHNSQPPQLTQTPPKRDIERPVSAANYDVSQTIVDGSSPMKPSWGGSLNNLEELTALRVPFTAASSAPRGPPRKPKQSGHALWVGNLPPATNVIDLKDHFSRDATGDIESVFLIAKSNCAFVNYKSEEACAAAVTRFHDSRFHGVRLVCRLRKGVTVPGSPNTNTNFTAPEDASTLHSAADGDGTANPGQKRPRVPERFFIVKSLTVEDLEGSRQSGVWATQTHNEVTLNEAYESADNVYLIFSANKSGEYFGYARMASPIVDDSSLALEAPSRVENVTAEADDQAVISTEATATAPKGRIIDDSVRGTIFWEADSSEDDNDDEEEKSVGEDDNIDGYGDDDGDDDEGPSPDGNDSQSEKGVVEAPDEPGTTGAQSLGKPFRIQWMSTDRVPFYRTRGLRNPWNANREVKIARDGTEIEPSVGRRLTQLFHSHLLGPTTPSSGLAGIGFQRPY